jgi:hypothetical protein
VNGLNHKSDNQQGQRKKGQGQAGQKFLASLSPDFSPPAEVDTLGRRLLSDYGAVFVARGGVTPPPIITFADESSVYRWQSGLKTAQATIGNTTVELQAGAMSSLLEARAEAQKLKLDITPRGADAARRSYIDTLTLWESRVEPGLAHWVQAGRLTLQEADRIRALSLPDQVREILALEARGIYFSKDLSKSILYSVAAPGASQHLSMLALDINETDNPTVRSILARHGWFQTVSSDTPHFTYLGVDESALPSLGLKRVSSGGRTFWVPDLN